MVQDLIGVDRNAVKLLAKVLPIINHHVCTGHGTSNNAHRGRYQLMGEKE